MSVSEQEMKDCLNDEKQDEFTPIHQPKHGSTKTSSVYYYIKKMLDDGKADFFSQYHATVEHLERDNRCVYLIKFADDPSVPLFREQGYELSGRHLSVAASYFRIDTYKGARGLSSAHYSEDYHHPTTNTTIAVCSYFDRFGQYACCRVKKGAAKDSADQILAADEHFIKDVKTNNQQVSILLGELFLQQVNYYKQLIGEVSELESNLCIDIMQLSFTSYRRNYLERAKRFVQLIEETNQYNENEIDPRADALKLFIRDIEETAEIACKLQADIKQTQQEDFIKQLQPLAQELKKLMDAYNVGEIIKRATIIEQIRELLFKFSYIVSNLDEIVVIREKGSQQHSRPKKSKGKKKNKKTDNYAKQDMTISDIAVLINGVFPLREECLVSAINGNYKAVKGFFPHVKSSIDFSFCEKLIMAVVNTPCDNQEKLQQMIKICDYLYYKVEIYRTAVFLLAKERSEVKFKVGNVTNVFYISVLIQAYMKNNFDAFTMFLRHGVNPNFVNGMICGDEVLPVLKAMLYFSINPKFKYAGTSRFVQLLLQHGVEVEYRREMVSIPSSQRGECLTACRNNMPNNCQMLQGAVNSTIELLDKRSSCLQIACDYRMNIEVIQQLMVKSEIYNVALSLSTLCNKNKFYTRFLPCCITAGLEVCDNRIDANIKMQELLKINGMQKKYIKILVYPANKEETEHELEILNVLYKYFFLQVANYNNEQLNKDIVFAIRLAVNARNNENQQLIAIDHIKACLLILAHKEVTPHNLEQIILLYFALTQCSFKLEHIPAFMNDVNNLYACHKDCFNKEIKMNGDIYEILQKKQPDMPAIYAILIEYLQTAELQTENVHTQSKDDCKQVNFSFAARGLLDPEDNKGTLLTTTTTGDKPKGRRHKRKKKKLTI